MTTTTTSIPARDTFGAKRVLPIVLGSVALLLAVASLAGGGAALWATGERDSAGFLTTDTHGLATDGHALVSDSFEISDPPGWMAERLATVRVEARAANRVFLGIGPAAEVDRYLSGVRHSEITDVEDDPFSVEYRRIEGSREPDAPAGQGFWRVQAEGQGTQTVTWPVEEGEWSVVAMNADGSRAVAVDASFGAKVSALGWIAFGLITAGGLLLVTGAGLVYLGARRPRRG
jgi:hypothetical protein